MVADFWSRCPDIKAKQTCYIKPTNRKSGKEYYWNEKQKNKVRGAKNGKTT